METRAQRVKAGGTTLDLTDPALHLIPLPRPFHLLQYPITTGIPPIVFNNEYFDFISVTRTREEVSVVVSSPPETALETPLWDMEAVGLGTAINADGPWKGIKVRGPMDLGMVGVMHELTRPLKKEGISVFAISTWNTDYLLVPLGKAEEAYSALREAGWTVQE